MKRVRIAVFGGSEADPMIYENARRVGYLLAEREVMVYCGGGSGVMEAVSRGVVELGGSVVGILPSGSPEEANPYVTIPVATGFGQARNVILSNSVHGAIAIGGHYGTLSEIALTLRQGKPVVGLDSWNIEGVRPVQTAEQAVNLIMELIQDT